MYLSTTKYGGVRSALTHMYRASGNDMDEGFKKELSQFMSGMKRVIASNKRQDGISIEEGKKAMSFDVYKTLCDVLHQGEVEDLLLENTFLTMEWNLMARSDNCVNMHIKHIQWRSDCLIFYFGTSKGNQTGETNPVILGMYTQTRIIQQFVLFLPWISTFDLILTS